MLCTVPMPTPLKCGKRRLRHTGGLYWTAIARCIIIPFTLKIDYSLRHCDTARAPKGFVISTTLAPGLNSVLMEQ